MFDNRLHPLHGWQPEKKSVVSEIPKLIDNLALQLDVNREELDLTFGSLDRLDKVVRHKGRRRCLELDIFPSLILYVGELIREATNGEWEFRVTIEQKQPIWEPWIVVPNGNACPPHSFLYEELYEGRMCHIRSGAESVIRQLLYARANPQRSIATIIIHANDNNEALYLSNTQHRPESKDIYLSLEIQERVNLWLFKSLQYYQGFNFFYNTSVYQTLS